MNTIGEKGTVLNKYQEAYEDLRRRDPIAFMDETMTEYTSQDYHQIDQMLEERRTFKEQTPKRDSNKEEYLPRRLVSHNKIDLGLPRTSSTPHKDTGTHEIYPIPEDEGKGRTGQQQSYAGNKENTHRKERVT